MQTQIFKFHVRDTVKQRQKERKWQEHIRQANTEIYSKSMGIRKKKFKKSRGYFNTIFYGNDDERFIMKPVMIWDIWRIPAIMM